LGEPSVPTQPRAQSVRISDRVRLLATPGGALETWAWIPILAVGVFLRVFRLDSVPRGLLYDEAYNGLDIVRIIGGARPIFLTENHGREALFIYLQALSVVAFGQTDVALRIVSAILGVLTLPVSYLLLRRLFGGRVALLGLAWLSVSLWHVMFSRIGLRTIALPLAAAVTFYFLWRGLDEAWSSSSTPASPRETAAGKSDLKWFGLAGVGLGIAQYTYTTARFLPIVVLLFAGYLFVSRRDLFRSALPGFIVCAVVAMAVFAPEAWYFVRHPAAFVTRAEEVSVFNADLNGGSTVDALVYSVRQTFGMFSFLGDEQWDHNISGRPVFDPLSSVFLVLGLYIAVRRWRDPRYAFVLIWLLLMLVPSMISIRQVPNFLRVTGTIPALFALPSLGAAAGWGFLNQRIRERVQVVPLALTAVAFAIGTYSTYHDYFAVWARARNVSRIFNADRWLAIDAVRQEASRDPRRFVIGAGEPDDPIQQYAVAGQNQLDSVWQFDSLRSLIFPPGETPTVYIFSQRDLPTPDLLQRYVSTSSPRVIATAPDGETIVAFNAVSPRPNFTPEHSLPARFGNAVEVTGYDVPTDVTAGKSLTVRWYWKILQPTGQELRFFNQVIDDGGSRLGQLDDRAFAPGYWPAGTVGVSTFDVPIDPQALTGEYSIIAGMYDKQTLERLVIQDTQGQPAGNQLLLEHVKVHGNPPPVQEPTNSLRLQTSDAIELLGYDLAPPLLRPGQRLDVTLHWTATGRPSTDYTVFVHLLGPDDQIIAQADGPPRFGQAPTSLWDAGDVIVDRHAVDLPITLSSGAYRLEIGLYRPSTGERLKFVDNEGQTTTDSLVFDGFSVR
jgi:4-amino-4-deoxy-L-arabinose transferase-like glycosyltransferase